MNDSKYFSVPLASPKALPFGKLQINLHFRSLNRTFDFAEGTHARKSKEKQAFLWYFSRLIVPLHLIWRNLF